MPIRRKHLNRGESERKWHNLTVHWAIVSFFFKTKRKSEFSLFGLKLLCFDTLSHVSVFLFNKIWVTNAGFNSGKDKINSSFLYISYSYNQCRMAVFYGNLVDHESEYGLIHSYGYVHNTTCTYYISLFKTNLVIYKL